MALHGQAYVRRLIFGGGWQAGCTCGRKFDGLTRDSALAALLRHIDKAS